MSNDHYISEFHLQYFANSGGVYPFNLKDNKFERKIGIRSKHFTENDSDLLSDSFVNSNIKNNNNIDINSFKWWLQKIEDKTARQFKDIIKNGLNYQNSPISYIFTLFLRSPHFKENFINKTLPYTEVNQITYQKQSDVIYGFFAECVKLTRQKINNPLYNIATQFQYRLVKSDGYKFFLPHSFVVDINNRFLLLPISPDYALSTCDFNKEKLVAYFENCKKYSDYVYFQNKKDYNY
jgi:hypothetical protein